MKKMVSAMCACILLFTAHAQYVQPNTTQELQGPVEFIANTGMMENRVAMAEENIATADYNAGLPVGEMDVTGTNDRLTKSINFEGNRGNLPWPVASGSVSIHFGPYTIDGIKGFSDGIYINLSGGDSVKAVADGVISGVFDVGGSNAVIIKHGKYFTTYNNLESIAVSKGDSIKAGKALGITSTANTGESQLLFMINDEKGTPLDPERWLKRI